MPRGDRTGPSGDGPMTGRKAGFCSGGDAAGYKNSTLGRGLGRGQRRGFRNMFREIVKPGKKENNDLE